MEMKTLSKELLTLTILITAHYNSSLHFLLNLRWQQSSGSPAFEIPQSRIYPQSASKCGQIKRNTK